MITTKFLLVVVLVFLGIAQQECSYRIKKIKLAYESRRFVGKFTLGTPAQEFKVVFDTEKTDFWVVGPNCPTDYCKSRKAFDSSKSSTFSDNNKFIEFLYRDTSGVSGETGSDVMTIDTLNIKKQDFIIASKTIDFSDQPYDSLLGIAYYTDSKNERFSTPFENLAKENSVNSKVFSFRLSPQGGVLVLGGVEPRYFLGRITYVPLIAKGFWAFNVSRTSIGDLSNPIILRPKSAKITIDSTIDFIGVPKKDLDSIASYFGAYYNNSTRENNVRCSFIKSSATLNFQIGRQTFRVPPALFISFDKTTNVCSLSIYSVEQDYYVLGNTFMQAFYTVYDAEKHQFGIALNNPKFNMNYI